VVALLFCMIIILIIEGLSIMNNLFKKMLAIALVGVQFMPVAKGMDFAVPASDSQWVVEEPRVTIYDQVMPVAKGMDVAVKVPDSPWVIEEPRVATADQATDIVRLFRMIADANTDDSLSGIDFIRLIEKLGPFTQYRVDKETCGLLNDRWMPSRCYQFDRDGAQVLRTPSYYNRVTVEPILEIVRHGPCWLLDMVLDWLRGMRVEDGVIRDDEMPAAASGLNSGTRWMVALSDSEFEFERVNGWKGAELMVLDNQGYGYGKTLLHEAVRVTNAEMVKLLINRGSSVNIVGGDVGSPLYELGYLIQERHYFINGLYPDHKRNCKVNRHHFPFQCSRLSEELKAIDFLRIKGAKRIPPWGETPRIDSFVASDDFYGPTNESTTAQ